MNDLRVQDADICGAFTISWVLAKVSYKKWWTCFNPFLTGFLYGKYSPMVTRYHHDETPLSFSVFIFSLLFSFFCCK